VYIYSYTIHINALTHVYITHRVEAVEYAFSTDGTNRRLLSPVCLFAHEHIMCVDKHTHVDTHTHAHKQKHTRRHTHILLSDCFLLFVCGADEYMVCVEICACTHSHTHARVRTNTHTPPTTWRLLYPVCVWTRWMYSYAHIHMLVYLQCVCYMVYISHIYTVTWFELLTSNAIYMHCAYTHWHTWSTPCRIVYMRCGICTRSVYTSRLTYCTPFLCTISYCIYVLWHVYYIEYHMISSIVRTPYHIHNPQHICSSVLQCVAGCCSVLNVWQYDMIHTASYYAYAMWHTRSAAHVVQYVAVYCSVLQCDIIHTASYCMYVISHTLSHVVQYVAVCCSVLQCVAVWHDPHCVILYVRHFTYIIRTIYIHTITRTHTRRLQPGASHYACCRFLWVLFCVEYAYLWKVCVYAIYTCIYRAHTHIHMPTHTLSLAHAHISHSHSLSHSHRLSFKRRHMMIPHPPQTLLLVQILKS